MGLAISRADGTTNFAGSTPQDLLIGAMSRSHIFEVPGVDFINLLKADLSGNATKCHGKVEKQDFLPVNRRSGNPGCTFSKCASVYKCVSGSKT